MFNYRCHVFYVCVKRITLCNCGGSSSSSSSFSCFYASLICNFGEFGAKNYLTDHQTTNTIHRFRDSVPVLKTYDLKKESKTLTTFKKLLEYISQNPQYNRSRQVDCQSSRGNVYDEETAKNQLDIWKCWQHT